MASRTSQTELRLVLLGRKGVGKTSLGNNILGLPAVQSLHGDGADLDQRCQKHRGKVAGRNVAIVESPDWSRTDCPPEEARRTISSFVALSSPGPHAFLVCVPVNQPADTEPLDALERLFGPDALSRHTLILFTFTDELGEGEQLEEHLRTQRTDLLELVERCGDRHHTLRSDGREEEEERKGVEELLEKVEQMVAENGTEHFSCPLYQEAEDRVRERQAEMVRNRRGGSGEVKQEEGGEGGEEKDCAEDNTDEEEMEKVRDEAEESVDDLDVNLDGGTSASSLSPSAPPSSFLWALWEKLTGWVWRLPKLVRREALLGALVGLFVGGPVGSMLGATVGSVATEVGRRKTQKTK